jgi:hypothetical protein
MNEKNIIDYDLKSCILIEVDDLLLPTESAEANPNIDKMPALFVHFFPCTCRKLLYKRKPKYI